MRAGLFDVWSEGRIRPGGSEAGRPGVMDSWRYDDAIRTTACRRRGIQRRADGVAPVNERLATDGDRVMVVTETTPWGLCRRFYDGRLVLVFSEYVFGESQGARRASA